jgi:hypothetical protein
MSTETKATPVTTPLNAFIAEAMERMSLVSSRGLPTRLPTFDQLSDPAAKVAAEVNNLADFHDAERQKVGDLTDELLAYTRSGRAAQVRDAAARGIDPPDDKEPQIREAITAAQARQRQYVSAQGPILTGPEMGVYLNGIYEVSDALDAEIRAKLGKLVPAMRKVRDQLAAMRGEVGALTWTRQPGKTRPADVEWPGEKAVTDAIAVLERYLD